MAKEKKLRKKRPPHKSKMVTGYIIYASEIRKEVIKKFPDRDFGDISKLVGTEWKNLPQDTKVAFEKRAQEQNAKSKAIAAEALELKKLADAAEERAKEHVALNQTQQLTAPQILPNSCNGFAANGHSYAYSNASIVSQQSGSQVQPLQIIQQQQQPIATTVQYCNNNNLSGNSLNISFSNDNSNSCTPQTSQFQTPQQQQQPQPYLTSQSPPSSQQQVRYKRNNIVYRKPATVRLRPKDGDTQTDPIKWLDSKQKEPLRYSQKFIDYLLFMRKSFND